MREKNLVKRRYCKDVVVVSELFFEVWERDAGIWREERRDRRWGQENKWKTVKTSSWQ